MKFYVLAFFVMLSFCPLSIGNNASSAEDEIVWALPDWPPLYLRKGGNFDFGDKLFQLLHEQITGYRQSEIEANVPRTMQLWKEGHNVCTTNSLLTKEREEYAYFSAFSLWPPLKVVIRPDNLEAFLAGTKEVDLLNLMKTARWRGVFIKDRSYGSQIDQAMADVMEPSLISFLPSQGNWAGIFKMISARRADYTVDFNIVVQDFNKSSDEKAHVVSLDIHNADRPLVVYVGCRKGPWGKKVISLIDRHIQSLVHSKDFRNVMESVYSAEERKAYQKDLEDFYFKRGQSPWIVGDLSAQD